jgi:hypothetical protein
MHSIARMANGQYRLGSALFHILADLAAFALEHNIQLLENEYTIASSIARVVTACAKSSVDFDQVLGALDEITDVEWWQAAQKFAADLAGLAKIMSE